ncbi:4-alpha-glucanotransferase [Luteolibacter sp. AS25]|uniref:4-alpha-glucanotransferase n=1 Tax=Luteolibacter sp. AS25 TaxID=3135776 RepID=UPI00398A6392
MRTAGILLPAFSTRRCGDLGIGDTMGIRSWVDWASRFHVGFLQLLPINENGTDESPYSAISSAALDPIYLSIEPGEIPCLTQEDIDATRAILGDRLGADQVDYPAVRAAKNRLLEISFSRFSAKPSASCEEDFSAFRKTHQSWLPDYCLFKLLIELNPPGQTWDLWPEEHRTPESARKFLKKPSEENPLHTQSRLDYFAYVQWLCFQQWTALRLYADQKNVKLMGDIPIGVSFHSSDVFFNREVFHTDWFGGTAAEGFCPENPFIHEWGQNWGIPLYNWQAMEKNGFAWWRARIAHLTEIFSIFRIDHILGFYRIYGFPWHPRRNHEYIGISHEEAAAKSQGRLPRWFEHPDDTQENKAANRATGNHRLRAILDAAGSAEIIAEDLGWVPEYVRPHLAELNIAGYRIPHWDSYADGSPVMGDNLPETSFAAFSTHDHDSICKIWENCRTAIRKQREEPSEHNYWASEASAHTLRLLAGFSGIPIAGDNNWPPYSDCIHWRLIKSLLSAESRYAVLMITDLFALKTRINSPGTSGQANWRLRLDLTAHQTEEYGRLLSNLIRLSNRHAICDTKATHT